MPTEFPNKKPKRRRYRTRMFDNRLSFPATSEQVRQLQAESEAEGRSVASLAREAIDQFLPRLRGRRRKRRRQPPAGHRRPEPGWGTASSRKRGSSWAISKRARRGSGARAR